MKLPKSFINPHAPANPAACHTLRQDACRVLRRFAGDLSLRPRDYSIRSRRQHRHQTEVFSLHTDSLYVEIAHASHRETVRMSYRTCHGRSDLAGGRDNAVSLRDLALPQGYANLLSTLRVLAGRRS